MLIPVLEVFAIVIPFAGIIALLHNKQNSESSIRLLLTSIGCMIMNIGTLLMETAQTEAAARKEESGTPTTISALPVL